MDKIVGFFKIRRRTVDWWMGCRAPNRHSGICEGDWKKENRAIGVILLKVISA